MDATFQHVPYGSRKWLRQSIVTKACFFAAALVTFSGLAVAQTAVQLEAPRSGGARPGATGPSSLEQRAASAPEVAFDAGQLTIVAKNSTLGAILQDVETQTGASIDMPVLPTDRVAGQFGPGPAREVLASLLNGSRFNYVLLGSPQNPNALERIVLIAKSSTSDQPGPGSQTAGAFQGAPFRQGPAAIPAPDTDEPTAQDNADEMVEAEQTANEQQADQNGAQPTNGVPAIKTPQQLLQELQRQQQAQQQLAPAPIEPQTQQRRPD